MKATLKTRTGKWKKEMMTTKTRLRVRLRHTIGLSARSLRCWRSPTQIKSQLTTIPLKSRSRRRRMGRRGGSRSLASITAAEGFSHPSLHIINISQQPTSLPDFSRRSKVASQNSKPNFLAKPLYFAQSALSRAAKCTNLYLTLGSNTRCGRCWLTMRIY